MRMMILRGAFRPVAVWALAVGLWLGAAERVWAGPLNPLDFASLGAFPTAPGFYTINTSGTPTITGPNGTITGVVFNGIAVFDFDSINLLGPFGPPTVGQDFTATGSLPLALLSRTDATIAGILDGSGQNGATSTGNPPVVPGGPGGGNGAFMALQPGGGPGGGGAGTFSAANRLATGGGGGGFGGPGGGPGGAAYGNLAQQLQGGSGGGSSFGVSGGGGGAIEIGAVGSLTVSGEVLANGGTPFPFPDTGGGGGGSGGGLLLHADSMLLTGSLSAAGGNGGGAGIVPGPDGFNIAAGGGGGGGLVTILIGSGGFSEGSGATIDVAGGAGAGPGGAGVISIGAVPEPSSLVLMVTGLLGLLRCAWSRRGRAAA